MTVANSSIFTSQIFGNSSGKTSEELSIADTTAQEQYLKQLPINKIGTALPVVPSNQRIAKDK